MSEEQGAPDAPAGWYPHPEMADTVRYWSGAEWTGHIAPASGVRDGASGTVPCPYCQTAIAPGLSRCPQCSGEFRHCSQCQGMVAVTTKSINVGLLRGGRANQIRCAQCRRILEGPAF